MKNSTNKETTMKGLKKQLTVEDIKNHGFCDLWTKRLVKHVKKHGTKINKKSIKAFVKENPDLLDILFIPRFTEVLTDKSDNIVNYFNWQENESIATKELGEEKAIDFMLDVVIKASQFIDKHPKENSKYASPLMIKFYRKELNPYLKEKYGLELKLFNY